MLAAVLTQWHHVQAAADEDDLYVSFLARDTSSDSLLLRSPEAPSESVGPLIQEAPWTWQQCSVSDTNRR